jgi:hypothetical protein
VEKKAATEMANVRTDLERIENRYYHWFSIIPSPDHGHRFIKWAVAASITITAVMFGYGKFVNKA